MGVLRAYRSSDGERLWEKETAVAHTAATEAKKRALESKALTGGLGWNSSLTVADGVLIVPLFDGREDLRLRGVSPADGATLWELADVCSRHATPATWSHGGRQYVLTATVNGELRLIDPRNGDTCWNVDVLGENHISLMPSEEGVIVNIGSEVRRDGSPKREDFFGRIGLYKLSPAGAEFVWGIAAHPPLFHSTWMDSCARRFLAVANGRVYYYNNGADKGERRLLVLEERSGRIVAEMPLETPAPLFYPLGDRLLLIRDASHSETEMAMVSADPKDFRLLSDFWHPPHMNTTAYEVLMETPIVGGRIYMRTKDGRVACYDLRK